MQECLPSTFQPALQPYMGSNLNTDKPLCRPAPPISLVCQTRCNVFLPPKIIPSAYMESPRMEPYLPYKPAPPSRKTSHQRISQNRKTSHPRTTRSSLFPPYNNSRSAIWRVLTGTLPLLGSRLRPRVRVCACPHVRVRAFLGRRGAQSWAGRQGGQPDTLSGTGRTQAAPDLACPAYQPCPTLPTRHARLPCLPCPVSRLSRVCHIVNRSATRAPRKTAFCQAILPFSDLSKRYTLIHNNLHVY